MTIYQLYDYIIESFGFKSEEVLIISGVMGVPISFLDKYCPEQFEILGYCASHGVLPKGIPNESPYLNGKWVYNRILIRNKQS
ncbi:MAG: adenine-specific methyltransferase EcoRI family protein [Bacteroidales bacterium]|nr:adenine-specific methyltransferase EcoRI family protein [Bacteroidales bacterium]